MRRLDDDLRDLEGVGLLKSVYEKGSRAKHYKLNDWVIDLVREVVPYRESAEDDFGRILDPVINSFERDAEDFTEINLDLSDSESLPSLPENSSATPPNSAD